MRRRTVLVGFSLLIVVCAAGLVEACSSFSGSDSSAPPDSDSGANDTGTAGDDGGASAADAGLVPPAFFDSFLAAGVGCNGWSTRNNGSATFLPTGHDQIGGSCRICTENGGLALMALPIDPPLMGKYTLELVMRQSPGTAGSQADLSINFTLGGVAHNHAANPMSPSAWTPFSDTNTIMLAPDGGEVSLGIDYAADAGGCIEVDEVKLTYSP